MLKIGVLDIQGDVSEHGEMLKKAFNIAGLNGEIKYVKNVKDLENINGIIIPGGESTTISRLLKSTGLFYKIKDMASMGNLGVMGTCAGTIIISSDTGDPRVEPMKLINIKIKRNAYGRQYSSFEAMIDIKGLNTKFPAIFIRAPIIEQVLPDVEIMSVYNNDIVFVRKDKIYALTFHPELTDNPNIHLMFIRSVGGISTGKE